jgi:hypothetical protein
MIGARLPEQLNDVPAPARIKYSAPKRRIALAVSGIDPGSGLEQESEDQGGVRLRREM